MQDIRVSEKGGERCDWCGFVTEAGVPYAAYWRKHVNQKVHRVLSLTCVRCEQSLDPQTAVWLEWDTRLGGPSKAPIPSEFSQGCFPYGRDCARVVQE